MSLICFVIFMQPEASHLSPSRTIENESKITNLIIIYKVLIKILPKPYSIKKNKLGLSAGTTNNIFSNNHLQIQLQIIVRKEEYLCSIILRRFLFHYLPHIVSEV